MTNKILLDSQRFKEDNSDDSIFYAHPRFVHHLDEGFRLRLTQLYRERIPSESIVLDLMSSWVSHLPKEINYKKVIGHGLNQIELEKNYRLDDFWIQDFNKDQRFPLEDHSIDYCLMTAAWQYLQEPEEIAVEIKRIIKPSGELIVSFSNRAFWSKAPRIWTDGSDLDHINYIKSVLISQGWKKLSHLQEITKSPRFLGLYSSYGDPFFSVLASP